MILNTKNQCAGAARAATFRAAPEPEPIFLLVGAKVFAITEIKCMIRDDLLICQKVFYIFEMIY